MLWPQGVFVEKQVCFFSFAGGHLPGIDPLPQNKRLYGGRTENTAVPYGGAAVKKTVPLFVMNPLGGVRASARTGGECVRLYEIRRISPKLTVFYPISRKSRELKKIFLKFTEIH